MPRKDPVSPELALYVLRRENGCAAVTLGEPPSRCGGRLTLDHVRDRAAMGGKRAPSDARHLVAICEAHHIWNGWATSHKPELRAYLARVEAVAS